VVDVLYVFGQKLVEVLLYVLGQKVVQLLDRNWWTCCMCLDSNENVRLEVVKLLLDVLGW